MEAKQTQAFPPPPGIIASLQAGFDTISTNLSILLLPLGLDLLLWLGPRLRVDTLFVPALEILSKQVSTSQLDPEKITEIQSLLGELPGLFEKFNLASTIRTLPIGVFSLMSGLLPENTPLGIPVSIQIQSDAAFILWTVLLILVGWIIGGIFFGQVSNAVKKSEESDPVSLGWSVKQTVFLSIIWLAAAFTLSTPTLLLLTIIGQISPFLAQSIIFVLIFFSLWLLVPLFFMPHGIFVKQQNALKSIFSSLRVARFTLPNSSLFVLSTLLISFGLNLLWSIPATSSWMTLVSIAGHAFTTTSLLAASFIYYHDVNQWLQEVLEKLKATMPAKQA